jgi:preprotein translocase subunit SecD
MVRLSIWRIFFVLLVCLLGGLLALPNVLSPESRSKLPAWWAEQTFSLGLDLQGGSQILLEVDVASGMRDRLNTLLDETRRLLRKERIGYVGLKVRGGDVSFRLRSEEDKVRVRKALRGVNDTTLTFEDGGMVRLGYSDSAVSEKRNRIVSKSIKIVSRRVNELGTKEPNIQRQGEDRILVQLPGVEDPARVKELLGQTAKMTFHLVCEVSAEGTLPPGTMALPLKERSKSGAERRLVVERMSLLSGENLEDARPDTDENFRPRVAFVLDGFGARRFADITRKNIGRRFAIVLDGEIITAPVIQGAIPGGSGVIQGNFTTQEASDLALLMRSGALPAPLMPLEERTVGPDLGADSIAAGENATVVAIALIAVFMILAYAFFGIVANIALLANIVLLVGALSLLGATLTLAGIAGIALTLGMAVDANVLIYERIKEELRAGRTIPQSIEAGYKRAITTIVDSNLTTLIGAALLFQFGSGSIRGFAVTLSLGILISMFTAISLTRVLVSAWLNWRRPKELSI